MSDLPPHIIPRPVPNAGTGLFTTKPVPAGEEGFHIDRPLVAVLDTPHLRDTCSNCFLWIPDNEGVGDGGQGSEGGGNGGELKSCLGCNVVRYCSKTCQSQSWKTIHKHECKTFSTLHPNVLPNTVRLALNLLLRKRHGLLPHKDWTAVLALKSHLSDFKTQSSQNADGLTTWQTIELMTQVITTYYSPTTTTTTHTEPEPLPPLLTRILLNTHTLTTPTLDPLGLCLSPPTALLNHSCNPNTHITFQRRTLHLRTLLPIPQNTELTLSYIDPTTPTETRISDLQSRYFFTCTCPLCSQNPPNNNNNPSPLPPNEPTSPTLTRALTLHTLASSLPPQEASPKLLTALNLLAPFPPNQQPYATILHSAFLNALAMQDWSMALSRALRAHFHVDDVLYPLRWHPVRVVRMWVLLRLVVQVGGLAAEGGGGGKGGKGWEGWDVEWRGFVVGLWREVDGLVGRSHGVESGFAREVRAMGEEMGVVGLGKLGEATEEEWARLRKIADRKYFEGLGVEPPVNV